MEHFVFFRRFLASPLRIGSIAPSSRALTRAMSSHMPAECRTVAELGAGTGSVTESILERLDPGSHYLAFEQDTQMQALLRLRFPRITVHGEANLLRDVMNRSGIQAVDAVISGLPFALMTPPKRERILEEVWKALRPGGRFIAFQYSTLLQGALAERFASTKSTFVWRNLPPAFVHVAEK